MAGDNLIPPVPGTGADSDQARTGYAQPAMAQPMPNIYVQIPAQKPSKAPWIVLIVICVLIFGSIFATMYSCSRMASNIMTTGSDTALTTKDTVAVIHMNTYIAASGSNYLTPETFRDELNSAENDSHVKAIVLRIDSGGGGAGSSEEIATYIRDCDKPIVVSIGDMCASGAYMAASQADYIYTNDGATIGAIGVIITKYDISELLDKLGITVDSITSGADKDESQVYSSLTDEQRAAMQEEVDKLNENFIEIVSNGRGLDKSAVTALATGRTWIGSQAVDLGLVDEVGTYDDALAKAAELGGISGDYDTVSFDESSSVSSLLSLL